MLNGVIQMSSEETKRLILKAAGKLFSEKGYDAVTMREIAREVGCSHTTIYLYFKDKETLLHQLSMPILLALYEQLKNISLQSLISAEEKLKQISREYILFGLNNQTMINYLRLHGFFSSRLMEF